MLKLIYLIMREIYLFNYFDEKLKSLNQKNNTTNQNIYLLKLNLKNYKHLIQFILEEKVFLKKMVHKII